MVKNLLAALGWSKRQWILFLLAFDAFIVILPVESAIGFNLNNALLWLTGIVILAYTVETQGLRLEMVRQNEIAIQPLVISGIETRTVQNVAPTSVYKVVLRNIGRGPALFIEIRDIEHSNEGGMRLVARFERVDYIEPGKDTDVNVTLVFEEAGEVYKKEGIDFVDNLNPRYANRTYDVAITYENIDGQKRKSLVRMGKGGIRLLHHDKISS